MNSYEGKEKRWFLENFYHEFYDHFCYANETSSNKNFMKFYELERDFRGISRRILKLYWIWLDNFTNIHEIVKKI